MIQIDSIVMPARFVDLCTDWHGAADCMLYAVSSTGGLTIGTLRPRGCDSEEKWYLSLWRDLSCDIGSTVRQAYRSDCTEPVDIITLREFENWVDSQVCQLEESYGLADWDACDD